MTSTPLTRVTHTLAFVAIAALAILATPALASPVIDPGGDVSSPSTFDGRSPDTVDAATGTHARSVVALAPDWFERYAAAHPYGQGTSYAVTGIVRDGRSPDTLDAASTVPGRPAGMSPDAYRALALRSEALNRLYGLDLSSARPASTTVDAYKALMVRSQALNAKYGLGAYAVTGIVRDGRSPDTLDAAGSTRQVELASTTGFDWADASIGAALGAGLITALVSGIAGLLLVRRRHQAQTL